MHTEGEENQKTYQQLIVIRRGEVLPMYRHFTHTYDHYHPHRNKLLSFNPKNNHLFYAEELIAPQIQIIDPTLTI
jgi:hypothetical protein